MTATAGRLRPLDLCDVLDQSVALYRENLITLLGIHAVGYVPFWLLIGLAGHFLAGSLLRAVSWEVPEAAVETAITSAFFGSFTLFFVLGGALLVLEPLVAGAMARAVSDQMLGRRASIRSAYAALRGRRLALVFASFIRLSAVYGAVNVVSFPGMMVTGLAANQGGVYAIIGAVVLNLAALAVGGFIFVYLGFLGQIIVIERRGLGDALSRSWRLVSGRLWRTSAMAAFLLLLVGAVTGAFQSPFLVGFAVWNPLQVTPETMSALATLLIATLAVSSLVGSPILPIGTTLMYFDLRVRREGLDVEMIAASIGRGERAP